LPDGAGAYVPIRGEYKNVNDKNDKDAGEDDGHADGDGNGDASGSDDHGSGTGEDGGERE